MEEKKIEDLQEESFSPSEEETTEEVTTEETSEEVTDSDDSLKDELERVKKGRTRKEKLLYTKKRVEEQLAKEYGDDDDIEDDDDKPLTIGMLKKMQLESSVQTAISLAEDIENPIEKELVLFHIENTIRPSGNPKEDLRIARALANSVKNSKILEEAGRKTTAKQFSSATSAPAKKVEKEEELSKFEMRFMKPPYNLTKDEIIKSRK